VAFCVRSLALMTEDAPQRVFPLREIFYAARYQIGWAELGAWCPRFAALAYRLPTSPALDWSSRQFWAVCGE